MKPSKITLAAASVLALALAGGGGCRSSEKNAAGKSRGPAAPSSSHKALHGGCLNVVETCAVGHAEVVLDNGVLRVWFVGGETETDKAVRAGDREIALSVKVDGGGEAKTLVLAAKPIELAEEKVGDCSCFEGKADFLAGAKKFSAAGKVHLKGKLRPVIIEYPGGYDPDDAAERPGGTSK